MTTAAKRKTINVARAQQILIDAGKPAPTSVTYYPQFNAGVLVLGPAGTPPVAVSENYCLTLASALEMMVILADLKPEAYLDYPQVFAEGSHFEYSQMVPWYQFANGAVRNAGQLGVYWKANSGDPGGKTAEANARADIAWG